MKGEAKILQVWELKFPIPPGPRRDIHGLEEAGLEFVLEPVGLPPDVQGDRVMEDPVQDGGGDHPVGEELSQLPKL